MRFATPPLRFLPWRGRSVAYVVCGDGPLLVCPAWWVGHLEEQWKDEPFRDFFWRLGSCSRVVLYDRPGTGLSRTANPPTELDDDVAVLDRLIETLGAKRLSLLGASSGGPAAIRWARLHPERVAWLFLVGSYANGTDLAPAAARTALLQLVRAHWGMGARALADIFVPDADAALRESFTRLQKAACDAATAAHLLELTYQTDVRADLAHVASQVLVVHREGDRAIPHSAGLELARSIAGAEFATLPGRNHPLWLIPEVHDLLQARLTSERGASLPRSSACRLDHLERALYIDGAAMPLTAKQYALLQYLVDRQGSIVSRESLVQNVWQQETTGSNVVDAVVRSLRKKLGPWAPSIETAIGHGYRFIGWRKFG